jgi:hypothetical protein
MGPNAAFTTGGSTSAEELIRAARIILDNCGVSMSQSKLSRLVRTYLVRVDSNGFTFVDFLANTVQLDASTRRRIISYADPTGEAAVRNVMRGSS